MRLGLAALLLASLTCVSLPAAAGDPAAAEVLFRQGRDAAKAGDFRMACEKFGESQRLDPAPGTLINLGECKAKLGLFASAWQYYREASDLLVGDPERRALAEKAAAEVEPRMSRLKVGLSPTAPEHTTAVRDGVELAHGSLDLALPVDAGEHLIVVQAPGREPKEFRVKLGETESKSVIVEPGPVKTEPVAASSVAMRNAGFAVGAIGLASLGVGIVTGVLTLNRKSTVEENCGESGCTPPGLDAAAEGKTLSTVSSVTFVVGLAALGTGILLVGLGWDGGAESEPAVAVGPVVSPTAGGLQVLGRF